MIDRQYFEELSTHLLSSLKPKEHLYIGLSAEMSQFIRLNGAKVRQSGTVQDAELEITVIQETGDGGLRKGTHSLTLTGLWHHDRDETQRVLTALRSEVSNLPADPYAQLPQKLESSETDKRGRLPDPLGVYQELMSPLAGVDVAGIFASGPVIRATASSSGMRHWFRTDSFSFDYSLYTPTQRAVKGTYAGKQWDSTEYRAIIEKSCEKLVLLERSPRKVPRGSYRAYLEPAAVVDLILMFSWGAIGEAAIRQGDSPLRKLRDTKTGESPFSKHFSLTEDFSGGEVPRFNDEGELAPEILPLIAQGRLVQTLISSRSAKEYGLSSTGATSGESLRAPDLAGGMLEEEDVLKRLGTGLYLSNLHYLNWSDQVGGRITGMTRYACFWVENGEIIAPIENLRFDESIFNLFGKSLEDLTRTRSYVPEVGSYIMRSLGGVWAPGLLASEMRFTL